MVQRAAPVRWAPRGHLAQSLVKGLELSRVQRGPLSGSGSHGNHSFRSAGIHPERLLPSLWVPRYVMKLGQPRSGSGRARYGIDRMIQNVETGRFERSLSALTAAGALVTAAEIFFEHDSASFGNKMMWIPVSLGPVGAVAGVAGFFSHRMAKTALPVASAAIVANGLQGTYLHARGIAQKPGGWSNARYNMEMGPPLLAPLLVTMVGGMGLLAAILRREK
jgi:hypothetical protein